ncbi:hypothetical protein Q8W71_27260 [Methylobacterium sp. NEAU 140]|uniref:hypothetical protein n=1 Tax=Methylobacterium sp. NEAU 140 TaxID=3064945 RepID=UPI00273245BF|nr:hypothetical protein [Methylobacterium sp. NEAU 140]MDP4026327.1 hypothetical protein [Methylobacterium sp. NEAU 140]
MPEPIPFPGTVRAIGETFPAPMIRVGREEAERRGITPAAIDAVTRHDRRLATYMLGQLGSQDPDHRRSGEFGLRRLIGSMERAA